MTEEEVSNLKAQETAANSRYYAPEPSRSCVVALAIPALVLLFVCAFFALWFSGAMTSDTQPATPSPSPTQTAIVIYAPTPIPMLVNPMAGYDQTVSFRTMKAEAGYRFTNMDGRTEERIVCYDTNICTWKSPAVPRGETLKIIYREPSPMWPFRLPLQVVMVLPDTLQIELD